MANEESLNQYTTEANVGVQFGGLFSALTLFFTGLLISNYNSYPGYVRVPVLFLVISTFGFVYSTLIYANATNKLNTTNLKSCRKALNTADILSEFMGVYPLLISVPLVIPVVTNDLFLISCVYIADMLGLVIYHVSKFSIIQEYYPKFYPFITGFVTVLMFAMLLLLKSNFQILLLVLVLVTIIMLFLVSLLTINKLSSVD